MIIDTLSNIEIYKNLSPDIYKGLLFLKDMKPDVELGVYTINDNVKAIVEEYMTSDQSSILFESHKRVIDIQYPIYGIEKVLWSPIEGMDTEVPYQDEEDRTYFTSPHSQSTYADIGNGIFAIFFEKDGHSPKHCDGTAEFIKKVTIKVNVGSDH